MLTTAEPQRGPGGGEHGSQRAAAAAAGRRGPRPGGAARHGARRAAAAASLSLALFLRTVAAAPPRTAGTGAGARGAVVGAAHRAAAVHALSETFPVQIFYYAWFGAPGWYDGAPTAYREWDHEVLPHWDEREAGKHSSGPLHKPPEDIAAAFYPARGLYSSLDRETQRRQMQEIADSKVDVVIFSWWRNMTHSDVQGRKGLFPGTDGAAMGALDGALAAGIKICFHLEPYNGRVHAPRPSFEGAESGAGTAPCPLPSFSASFM